jgi:hypothetical protein
MEDWFYVRMTGQTLTYDDGSEETIYPLAFIMSEMSPLCHVTPPAWVSTERWACDKAFALACRYSGGRDLVEEMVAANYWPLGRRNECFQIEMVQVPVFGPLEGVPFPQFGRVLPPDQDCDALVAGVEEVAQAIVGAMSDKEYLTRRSESGTMPWLNQVFEELGIHHEKHVVPPKVLASIEKKQQKAAAKNATVAAESKKRKDQDGSKVLSKWQKVVATSTASTSPATSFASASEEGSVEDTGGAQNASTRGRL